MRNKVLNVFILVGAITAGATGMWFWDDSVQKFQVKLVEQQLLAGIKQPTVDIQTIGFHGATAGRHTHHHDHDHEEGADHHHDDDVPLTPEQTKQLEIADAKATALFSTPGGAYTKDDIAKNGSIPPHERFDRVEFLYSMKAHEGDPIDPILHTKTAGAFDWYVNGQVYHFASIASLEEFVIRAKQDPKSIQSPDHYVEKSSDTRLAAR